MCGLRVSLLCLNSQECGRPLRNNIFDPCRTLLAVRHSGQGRRPRPGIQEEKLDSGLRGNDGQGCSCCFCPLPSTQHSGGLGMTPIRITMTRYYPGVSPFLWASLNLEPTALFPRTNHNSPCRHKIQHLRVGQFASAPIAFHNGRDRSWVAVVFLASSQFPGQCTVGLNTLDAQRHNGTGSRILNGKAAVYCCFLTEAA
jgi:hypothetical protein